VTRPAAATERVTAARVANSLPAVLRAAPFVIAALAVATTALHRLPAILPFQWAMLHWPFPTQGSESLVVWEAHLLAEGKSIYVANTPDRHDFTSGPYTPLYFAAVAAMLKLTPTLYTGGRAITFGAWLLLIVTVAALVLATTRRRSAWLGALVAAFSLVVFAPGVIWAVRVKPTIPALALAALGLLIVQRTWDAPKPYYRWALICFVAGYFTKQTTLAAAGAAALFLLVQLGPRAALRFVALGAVGGAVPFALLTLATRGEFLRHIVTDRRLAWQFQLVRNFGGLFLRDYWPLLAAALVAACALAWARVPSVAPYYLLTALIITPITIGVEGADHDHLIELAAAAALAVGVGLAAALAGRAAPALAAWPVAVLLVVQVVTGWTPDRWYASELAVPDPQVRLQLERIVTNIRGTPGDVLAEEIGLPLLAGKPVTYDDPQAMAALARVGRWDERQLLDDLNHRRFSLIILPANPRDELWTPEVLAAIHANYTLKFRDVWFTWEAKP
jgi:hypothetical protein